eukprot:scaffold17200_cov101-Isochrysis_galbana.AAC.2
MSLTKLRALLLPVGRQVSTRPTPSVSGSPRPPQPPDPSRVPYPCAWRKNLTMMYPSTPRKTRGRMLPKKPPPSPPAGLPSP